MKTIKQIQILQESVDNITCNMCGEGIKKNKFGMFDEHLSIEKSWGYGSVFDGETHSIDLCEKCYISFINTLKLPYKNPL